MLCDELKAEQWLDYSGEPMPCYQKAKVDAAIAELKAENDHLRSTTHSERDEYIDMVYARDKEIAELKEQLESEKASRYAESVDAGMRERRLKRALWLARADRAKGQKYKYETWERNETKKFNRDVDLIALVSMKARTWRRVEIKCLKKAKEYK